MNPFMATTAKKEPNKLNKTDLSEKTFDQFNESVVDKSLYFLFETKLKSK